MSTRFGLIAGLLLATLLAAGCASMSGLSTQASVQSAGALAAEKSLAGAAASGAAWPASDWWRSFNDSQLDQLIDEALVGSPTLKIAAARTRKALAFADNARSGLYPQVNADLEITRERFSERGAAPPPFAGSWNTLHQLQATLNWELDFWGKNRAAYESALGQARATAVDAYAARLALSSNIAQAYVQLQRAYLQLDVAEATLKEREQLYALTRERNAAGIDSRLELKQAESALPATREQIAQLQETIQLMRNQLAALLGQGPDRGLAIARPAATALAAVALPSTLPAELLGRRPDLIAQRARVEAAQKDIASAKAEFYPNVNLMAFVGLQSFGGAGFLSAASRMMGFGPAVSLPIFDAGRLRANLAGKNADYDIAVEQYNQTLAEAIRDVVDQLASFRSVDEQRRQQVQAQSTAQEAYDLALLRYREGIGNYLQVLSAEAPLLTQQGLDADLRSRQLTLAINLIRALGGGFDEAAVSVAAAH
ncbi:MAG TPA: efflux transporter outer membrane subunit [Casimicrobiaceae bacterium]|jgi:NodT family efflux transporter outer membrane factor (OMF) lipoprotein|nr:efflux transporter outer membrane subunit [Casimicrobiaceae bacterium]